MSIVWEGFAETTLTGTISLIMIKLKIRQVLNAKEKKNAFKYHL